MAVAIWGAVGAVAGAAGPTLGALVVEQPRLAVGVLHQPARRDRQLHARPRVLPEGREAQPRPAARSRRRRPAGGRAGARRVRHRRDRRRGAGPAPASCWHPRPRLALVAIFVWRCARVPNPLLDLALFEARNFRWANAAHARVRDRLQRHVPRQRAVPHPGLGLLDPAAPASPSPSDRSSWPSPHRSSAAWPAGSASGGCSIPGGLVWASGGVVLLARVTDDAELPDALPPGHRAAPRSASSLCLPQLSSAAVQGLPPDRFGSGSAVNQAVRNLGATLGVALVVAFTSDLTPATALDGFRQRVVAARGQRRDRLAAVDPLADARRAGLSRPRSTLARSTPAGAVAGTVVVVEAGAGWRSKSLQS